MKLPYMITPNGVAVACIGKVGSSSIGKAIMKVHYPDRIPVTGGASKEDAPGWQAWCPKESEEEVEVTDRLLVVRNPVDRFISACRYMRLAPDVVLSSLRSGEGPRRDLATNFHFRKCSDFLTDGIRIFRFPEHCQELWASLGVVGECINRSIEPELTLTDEQVQAVEAYYIEDLELFNLTREGTHRWLLG